MPPPDPKGRKKKAAIMEPRREQLSSISVSNASQLSNETWSQPGATPQG